jgi:hypothetical protein
MDQKGDLMVSISKPKFVSAKGGTASGSSTPSCPAISKRRAPAVQDHPRPAQRAGRREALQRMDAGESMVDLARTFGVDRATLYLMQALACALKVGARIAAAAFGLTIGAASPQARICAAALGLTIGAAFAVDESKYPRAGRLGISQLGNCLVAINNALS